MKIKQLFRIVKTFVNNINFRKFKQTLEIYSFLYEKNIRRNQKTKNQTNQTRQIEHNTTKHRIEQKTENRTIRKKTRQEREQKKIYIQDRTETDVKTVNLKIN